MSEHPDLTRLDALALGGEDAEAVPLVWQQHLETCPRCADYVTRLRAELGGEVPLRAPAALSAANKSNVVRLIFVATPALAVAAALLLFFRPPVPVSGPPAPAVSEQTHFKGGLPLAIVLERAGVQSRHVDKVLVRPFDRLRIEVSVDSPSPIEVGVLDTDGNFSAVLAATMLDPGTHYSERVIRFDAHPNAGWVLAGSPEAVRRAGATRDFQGVSVIPILVDDTR